MIETKLGLGGYVTNIRFIDKDGNSFRPKEFSNDDPIFNRIVDAGLDMPASTYWANLFTVGAVGIGTSATTDDMTKLESYVAHSNTYPNSSVLNGYEMDLDSVTKSVRLFRTITISANTSGASIPVSELSVGKSNVSDPDIFARILLPELIEWPDGMSFQFTYNLRVNYPDIVNNPQAKTIQVWDGASLANVEGDENILIFDEGIDSIGVLGILSDGSLDGKYFFEPSVINKTVSTAVHNIAALDTNASITSLLSDVFTQGSKSSYNSGDKQITRSYTFDENVGPGQSFNSFGLGQFYATSGYTPYTNKVVIYDNPSYSSDYYDLVGYVFKADSSFTKQVGRSWKVQQTLSWDRV